MYLKRMEIQGFKSFATATTIDFLPPQHGKHTITAIVGPNGSGKSNVYDAIRWVMGEQRMKHLRGKKSEDIIFSGSETKGKMGMASVSMTLDNSEKRADLEYDELVISRRLYRSGESEYLINGQVVRLIDLQLLLAKAQFGQGSYAVVGQGTIDRMLLQSPVDRKAFFDEAAGIREFQIKRRQAFLKLERTRDHIAQADLLLKEITPRLKTLSRQVKKLEERQDIELSLREAQEQYYTSLFTHNQNHLDQLQQELIDAEKQYATSQEQLQSIQQELALLAQAASRQDVFEQLQREYQAIVKQKNDCERDRAVLQGKLQSEYSKVGKQNVAWLEQKITELTDKQTYARRQYIDAEKAHDEAQQQLARKKQALEELLLFRTELRGKLANIQQELLRAEREQSYQRFTGLKAVQAILQEKGRFNGVYGAVAQLGKVDVQYQLAMDVAAGGHISSLVVRDDEVGQACIEYLRQYQLGYATFLPLTKITSRFISQDVYEYIGRNGVAGLAVDLIEYDEQFLDIFSYIFGATLIVESLDVARSLGIGRIRMVTLDGDVLETSGSMKGGFRRKNQNGMSFSTKGEYVSANSTEHLSAQFAELQQQAEQVEISYERMHSEFSQFESAVHVTSHKLMLAKETQAHADQELSALEQELSLHTMSPGEYNDAMKHVSLQKDTLDTRLIDLDQTLDVVQKKIEQFNDDEEQKKKRVFALQDAMQEQQVQLNGIVETKNSIQVNVAKYQTKQEDLLHELHQELRLSIDSILERGQHVVSLELLQPLQETIQKLKYKLTLIGGIDDDVVTEYEETKQRHDDLSLQLGDLRTAMKDLDLLIAELDVVMKKKRNKAFKQIRKEFSRYFTLLFEGGKADLVEIYGYDTDEDADTEEALEEEGIEEAPTEKNARGVKILKGIDVRACPPGKKITRLQSLSGGERTMTSIALICAILKVNPSPFVVLDEVEAALDEANTVRFTKILQELSLESQFILITHNRATMHAADALYGVTMGNDGMSRLLSVKLEQAVAVE